VLFHEDGRAGADDVLKEAGEMIKQHHAFYLSANLRAFRCRMLLSDGDIEVAQAWLQDYARDSYDILSFYEIYRHFTTARAYITIGSYNKAIILLGKLLRLSERCRRPLDIIESYILLAISHWKKSRGGQAIAIDCLEKSIVLSEKYGFTQVFANEGAELTNIMHRLQKRVVQKGYTGEVPLLYLRSLYIDVSTSAKTGKGLTGGRMPKNLKFTERQLTIMQFLCDGYNRNEIAVKLGLKPYTIKEHIELIYNKLNVSSRMDALIKIKELGIQDSHANLDENPE